jgi:hypothetical protein
MNKKTFVLRANDKHGFAEFRRVYSRINGICRMLCDDLKGRGIDTAIDSNAPGYFAITNFKSSHETILYMLASEYDGVYIQEFYS